MVVAFSTRRRAQFELFMVVFNIAGGDRMEEVAIPASRYF